MKKLLFNVLALLPILIFAQNFPAINPSNIQIVRDEYYIPHVFANTDAEAAYGLAWVNAEDAFAEMQDLLIIGKGMMGKYEGIDGAKADFFSKVIKVDELVDEKMPELPVEFLKYLDGYVQGINAYAKLHMDELKLKELYPVEVKDVLKSYVVVMSFLTDASRALDHIYNGKLDELETGLGSNAFAINSNKTADGNTYLCINPHMQMVGNFSFYEAHIQSKEGLNIHGAIFMGGTSIYMGNNENLGWGMTWNYFDQGDIYKLKMNPKKKNQYWFDGEWKKLEKNKFWLHVRVGKKFTLPVPKKSFWSEEMGPVLKSNKSEEYYAFKFPAFYDIKAPYQWYKMNKAKNYEEFKEALDLLAIGMFNIVYADKDDNIMYVSYGQIPYRNDSLVQMPYIPGTKSEYVWHRLHKVEEMPFYKNPECGYLFNTNNTPFYATDKLDLTSKLKSPLYIDQRPGNNNRATRLIELFTEKDKISFEELQQMKFDNAYSPNTYLVKKLSVLMNSNPADYPEISDILNNIQAWDYVADSNDVSAANLMVSIDFLFKKKHYGDKEFVLGFKATDEEILQAVKDAKQWFLQNYGTVNVPLGQIFKAKKGDMQVTCPGFPDALAANYGDRKDSVYIAKHGDTYTQFVKFDKNGVVEMRTLVPFGDSYHPNDPGYFNQAELFKNQQTKKMSLNKEEILQNAVKVYHPE